MDNFEKGAKEGYRFSTTSGLITIEDLFNLPLTTRGAMTSLDDIAKALNKQLKESEVESFVVETKKSNTTLKCKFEIVKRVIEIRLEDQRKAEKRMENKDKKELLISILAEAEINDIKTKKSPAQIRKMIDSISDDE